MRRVTYADGSAASCTCGYGLSSVFIEWRRIGESEMEQNRQQLVDMASGQVREVRVRNPRLGPAR